MTHEEEAVNHFRELLNDPQFEHVYMDIMQYEQLLQENYEQRQKSGHDIYPVFNAVAYTFTSRVREALEELIALSSQYSLVETEEAAAALAAAIGGDMYESLVASWRLGRRSEYEIEVTECQGDHE